MSRMSKFNATRTELFERVNIAYNEAKRKKLVGGKAVEYIAARMFELGEIAYREQYAPQKAAAVAERERFAAALGKPTGASKASKPSKPTGKPTGASKASRASKPTGASKASKPTTTGKTDDAAANK